MINISSVQGHVCFVELIFDNEKELSANNCIVTECIFLYWLMIGQADYDVTVSGYHGHHLSEVTVELVLVKYLCLAHSMKNHTVYFFISYNAL